MMDDTQLLQEAVEQQLPQSTETQESVAAKPNTPEQQQESSEERNFRSLREKSERIARERDEALARLQQYESQQQQQPEADLNLGENDLVEGKHLKKSQGKVENKIKALEARLVEAQLRADFPDIKTVLSDANIALLREQHPELAKTIGSSTDLYSKAVSAYTMIRKLGIHQDPSPFDSDKATAMKNAAKPRSVASVSPQQGDTPLSRANAFANGLTPELQKQLLKEMIDAQKAR
jgi:hypothetical protein